MREMEFRGKRIDNGEWVEGYLFMQRKDNIVNTSLAPCIQKIDMYDFYSISYEVDPETVGQYSGLKDIFTDQKCYVNDLIDWYDRHKDKIVRFKVVFKDGSFVGVPIDSPNISYSLSILLNMTTHSEAGKIVGNINE